MRTVYWQGSLEEKLKLWIAQLPWPPSLFLCLTSRLHLYSFQLTIRISFFASQFWNGGNKNLSQLCKRRTFLEIPRVSFSETPPLTLNHFDRISHRCLRRFISAHNWNRWMSKSHFFGRKNGRRRKNFLVYPSHCMRLNKNFAFFHLPSGYQMKKTSDRQSSTSFLEICCKFRRIWCVLPWIHIALIFMRKAAYRRIHIINRYMEVVHSP